MRIKPMTPLGLAFTFSVLLAGWASAANGLQAPSGHSHSDALASSAQHQGKVVSTLQRPAGPPHQAQSAGTENSARSAGASVGAGQHGGSVQRFHDSASCPLPNGVALPGNWTHGDYVSAWAATSNPAAVQTAAHSSCGKPAKGAGHSKDKHGKHGKHDEHGDRKQGKGAGHSKSKHDKHSHGD